MVIITPLLPLNSTESPLRYADSRIVLSSFAIARFCSLRFPKRERKFSHACPILHIAFHPVINRYITKPVKITPTVIKNSGIPTTVMSIKSNVGSLSSIVSSSFDQSRTGLLPGSQLSCLLIISSNILLIRNACVLSPPCFSAHTTIAHISSWVIVYFLLGGRSINSFHPQRDPLPVDQVPLCG